MNLRAPQDLFDFQKDIVRHICQHERSMVWARVGAGKTAATATAIQTLQSWGQTKAALIFGTRRIVQQVWGPECAKWEHLQHMRVHVLRGKHREYLLQMPADIYVINYEAIPWLITQLHHTYFRHNRPLPFDMVVFDEVTKVKNAMGKRWRFLYEGLMPAITRRVGLTGTPAPNGYLDLHGQYQMLDDGQRLGTSIGHYKTHFFQPSGYGGYKYVPKKGAREEINGRIADMTTQVIVPRRTPEPQVNDIMVDLEPGHRKLYEQLERDLFAHLDCGETLEVFNQASLSNKCLQFANGTAITNSETKQWAAIHDAKLEALDDILEEAAGRPILLAYNFRHDMHRIVERYRKGYSVAYLGPGVSDTDGVDIENRWNNGEYNLLVGHPACLGGETEVLTENRGWVPLTSVSREDRVHDGFEFVSHQGCQFSGYRNTIEVFGVHMTPGHKLRVGNVWVEAKDVKPDRRTRRMARIAKWKKVAPSPSEMSQLWTRAKDFETESPQAQSEGVDSLSTLSRRPVSSHDRDQVLPNMGRTAQSGTRGHGLRELRQAWDFGLRKVEVFPGILHRYVSDLLRHLDYRTGRQRRLLWPGQLLLGYEYGATGQQTEQSQDHVSRRGNTSRRISPAQRVRSMHADTSFEPRDDGRCRSTKLPGIDLRTGKRAMGGIRQVYDLVNCGPRHQFLIRNAKGEIFISHNSIGHGLNLQYGGHEIVWFGLTWNLELYDQFIGRLDDRHGQTEQVIIHRILVDNTVDLVVREALRAKVADQEGLRQAMLDYRRQKFK